ncbi:MAG: hypothetical protein CMJ78_20610 [Planctomycetaceae bacterium]|nr:hypothetical protein [Planctomycetaceae bacterium]
MIILLADSQLKSAESSQRIIDLLEEKYQEYNPTIYYAVMTACGIDFPDGFDFDTAVSMQDLFQIQSPNNPSGAAQGIVNHAVRYEISNGPHFLSYVTSGTVRAPGSIP